MSTPLRLMVIVPDRLSEIVRKGEVTARYYNPGDLFSEVHLVMTNDDTPDPAAVQPMAGSARLFLHNLPAGKTLFVRSLGWRPWLLKGWTDRAVALAARIKPDLIRCHGNGLNAFAARAIRKELGVPYVVSLHGNPDIDYYRGRLGRTWTQKLLGRAIEAIEILGIKDADMVLPVYSPIISYLEKHGITRHQVVYNVVGQGSSPKSDYRLDRGNVRAMCVGRQETLQKDPKHILEAIAGLPDVHLTLIGDGDLHDVLVAQAKRLGISDRVRFIRRMPNADVLKKMAHADIYVYASINYEISKTCIEAALTGLPVILNDRNGDPARELVGGHFLLVPDTCEGYREAIQRVINDDDFRENLGRKARRHAMENWAPEKTEAAFVEIYRRLLSKERDRAA